MPRSRRFAHRRVRPLSRFDPHSFRVVKRGKHRVVVGCPHGFYNHRLELCRKATRAQAVLHPKGGKNPRTLFSQFHEGATHARRVTVSDGKVPAHLWALGKLHSVVYHRPGDSRPSEHVFREPKPLLCSDEAGRRLYVMGGGYRIRPEGIIR